MQPMIPATGATSGSAQIQLAHHLFDPIGWHSFRHSVSAWGKEAGLELEDVKTLLRHEDIATTSNVYGDLGMDAKRRIQKKLVEFVRRQASQEASRQEAFWQRDPPVTIQ